MKVQSPQNLVPDYVLEKIRNNDPAFTEWNASPTILDDNAVDVLVAAMQKNSHLKSLTLRGGKIPKYDYKDPHRIGPRGAKLLASCPNLEKLTLDGNPIGDQGAIDLAKNTTLRKLSLNGCAISKQGAEAFLSNNALHDVRLMMNIFSSDYQFLSSWEKLINAKLDFNQKIKRPINYWGQAAHAIDNDNYDIFCDAIQNLPNGIDTFELPKNGETLLLYAVAKNKPKFVLQLLNCGAKIENSCRKEYTPLFIAVENDCLDVCKLLLQRGGNLTGEFHFNAESCLSICIFKLLDPLYKYLSGESLGLDVAQHTQKEKELLFNLSGEFVSNYRKLIDIGGARWECFAKNLERSINLAMAGITIIRKLTVKIKLNGIENRNYLTIFKLLHDKYRLLNKKKMLWPNEYKMHLWGAIQTFRLSVNLCPQVHAPRQSLQQLEQTILQINNDLKNRKENQLNWQNYPKLFISQFRCVHYYKHYFTEEMQQEHSSTCHLNRLAPAAAVYDMANLEPNQHQLLRETDAMDYRAQLVGAWEGFKHTGPVEIGGIKYQDADAAMQERATNNYAYYKEDIRVGRNQYSAQLKAINAAGYSHFATSDLPGHALRYGYGLKQVSTLADKRLFANYSQAGVPENLCLGKIIICLFTPLAMYKHHMRHVAGAHNRDRLSASPTIIWERETSAPGGVESDYVFYEAPLQVPDLFKNDEQYLASFGLTNTDRQKWLTRFKDEQTRDVENGLMSYLVDYMCKYFMKIAYDEAERQDGHLIFRHYDQQYGLTPEPLKTQSGARITPKWESGLFENFNSAFQPEQGGFSGMPVQKRNKIDFSSNGM